MTKEERVKIIQEEIKKAINPALTQEFTFYLNEIVSQAISQGMAPHDIPIALKCLSLATEEANDEGIRKGEIEFIAGKFL